MVTIEVKRELDFDDLQEMVWGQAVSTLDTIYQKGKEDELMDFLASQFEGGEIPTETEVNDILAYDWEYVFDALGISEDDDEDEDEEDDDDEEEEE